MNEAQAWKQVARWHRRRLGGRAAWLAGLALLVIVTWRGAEVSVTSLVEGLPLAVEFLGRLFPADWSVLGEMLRSCLETVSIAFLGTIVSVLLGLVMGLLAASNLVPAPLAAAIKAMLAFIRSIPVILLALLFVAAVGLGPFPGTLAIAFHGIGMLGKLYADEFEAVDPRVLEAVWGTGGGWLATVRYGVLPQALPQLFSLSLFRFEMNVREATVLGLVGAGGIGYYIQLYARAFQYPKVATMVLAVIAMVLLVDLIAHQVRQRIL
jgi:phosphonate transport system permease protein